MVWWIWLFIGWGFEMFDEYEWVLLCLLLEVIRVSVFIWLFIEVEYCGWELVWVCFYIDGSRWVLLCCKKFCWVDVEVNCWLD